MEIAGRLSTPIVAPLRGLRFRGGDERHAGVLRLGLTGWIAGGQGRAP